MDRITDNHLAGDRWAFDADVTHVFEDMLRRSIPQYDVMRDTVTRLALSYAKPDTYIVGLGCSRGDDLAPLVNELDPAYSFLGLEVSPPMIEAARARFAACVNVEITQHDLRTGYPDVAASVTLSVLTLQFTPIEYRPRIVRDICNSTLPCGAFIMVEKLLGGTAEIDALYVQHYYAMKRAHGYTDDQIERKRLSLEGVLVPVTARWNEELLRDAGFRQVECFWRWLNFAGWIAIKD